MDDRCLVVEREALGAETFRLRLRPPQPFGAQPGQFVMVKVAAGIDPLLRRPLSIHRAHLGTSGDFELLFRAAGAGTRALSLVRPGEHLAVLGPLGRGFRSCARPPVLVGGGIGVAPLLFFAETLLAQGLRPTLLLGAKRDRDLLCHDDFACLAVPFRIATEDGSKGETGFVTRLLEHELASTPHSAVYACGPVPMLAAVAALCAHHAVPCQVSLEAHMACGVGACLGCVIPGTHGPSLRVCHEGPVFDASDVKW